MIKKKNIITTGTTTTDDDKMEFFPLNPEDHGTDIVSIEVGHDQTKRVFKVHKAVLCKASPFFAKALSTGFKEEHTGVLKLPDHDAISFSVLYHYLYSGDVRDANHYTKNRIPDDVLWLRTFKLADATMLHSLLKISCDRLREFFNNNTVVAPSVLCAYELYNTDYPQPKLIEYIIAHSAWWIRAQAADWKPWVKLIESVKPFGHGLARHLAKTCSRSYTGEKEHPSTHSYFDTDNLFPDPAEPVGDDVKIESPALGSEYGDGEVEEEEAEVEDDLEN